MKFRWILSTVILFCTLVSSVDGLESPRSFEEVEAELKKRYFLKVPFAVGEKAVTEAVEAFFAFLELPDEVKFHIFFSVNPNSRRGESGFVRRDPKDPVKDDYKEYFNYHGAILDRYPEFLAEQPVVRDFVEKALPIWLEAQKRVREVMITFEGQYPGITERFFSKEEPEILLRFLKYNWKEAGEYLAKPHYDVGSCTLAIAESAPGLRIGSCTADLAPVTHTSEEAIFMMGKNFPKITDDTFLPSWHDVVQVDKTTIGQPFARWAVVCFFEVEGLGADPHDKTHQPVK